MPQSSKATRHLSQIGEESERPHGITLRPKLISQDPIQVLTLRLERAGSPASAKLYKTAIGIFCRFLGTTPVELLTKIQSGEVLIEDELNAWLDHLQTTGEKLAPSTLRCYCFGIKKFCRVNLPRFTFYWDSLILPRSRVLEPNQVPSKAELLRILAHANLRDKVILCLASSSGIREAGIAGLKIKDVDLTTYRDVGVIHVAPELSKGGIAYLSFCTPQAKGLILEYLKVRRKVGPLNPNDPLILSYRGIQKSGVITNRGIASRWRNLLVKTGLDRKGLKMRSLRFHSLRRFFATTLTNAGILPSPRERLLGHVAGFSDRNLALDSSYYRPETGTLLAQYRKAIPALTIGKHTSDKLRKREKILALAEALRMDKATIAKMASAIDRAK